MVATVLLISLLFGATCSFAAKNLEVIVTETKLPYPLYYIPTVYDGEDAIFLIGGSKSGFNEFSQDVLKYSLSDQTVKRVGVTDDIQIGSAVWGGDGDIFYFGSYRSTGNRHEVWKFTACNPKSWTVVSNLTERNYKSTSVADKDGNAYIFGGFDPAFSYSNKIMKFSKATNKVETVATAILPGGRLYHSAVWDDLNENAYIFGGATTSGYVNDILKFNSKTGTLSKLAVSLPTKLTNACAIYNGREAYIVGGYDEGAPWSVLRFTPSTNELNVVNVTNFPSYAERLGCAYVEKLNRIYLFGGYNAGTYMDSIMYIDLNRCST
jgi:hypothetical protein